MSGEQASNVTNVPGVLKAFVIISGIMLLIGAIVLAVLIMVKAADDGHGTEAGAPVDLELPTGAKIKQMEIDGKRLVLLVEDAAGQQYMAVVDALSGERLSLIRVTPSP